MSDVRARSFDAPRERPAPVVLTGLTVDGAARSVPLSRVTVVAVVKPHCDGCRDFLRSDRAALGGVDVVVISAEVDEEWRGAPCEVLIAPAVIDELEVRGAPWYLVIDPARRRVVGEGTLFSARQVAEEVAPFVTS